MEIGGVVTPLRVTVTAVGPGGKSTGTCASRLLEFKKVVTGAASPPNITFPMDTLATSFGPVPKFVPVINIGAPGENRTESPIGRVTDANVGVVTGGMVTCIVM